MIRLSVIVPMYNVAPFVEKCIRSMENQDIPREEYEIICVNDGSTDLTRDYIFRFQNEYGNIKLIEQDNQGVSKARNKGIEMATGQYLLFVDADDYISENTFDIILKNIILSNAQVSFLGYTILNEDNTIQTHVLYGEHLSQIHPGIAAYHLARGDGRADPDRSWAILMERDFIIHNNLRYLPDVPYLEDGEFIARVLCLAEKCIFDPISIYFRTNRPGSATNSNLFHSEKAKNGFLLAASNLKSFQQRQYLTEMQRDLLNQVVCKYVILVISSAQKSFSLKRIKKVHSELKGLGLEELNLKAVKREFYRLGFLYNRSVWLLITYQYLVNILKSIRIKL